MTMDVKSEAQPGGAGGAGPQKCAGCGKPITDRFMLKALDMLWHEDCLKCSCCDCRLGEVGSTFYTKANLILCKRDYLRLFGNTGYCAACSKVIPAFEMVMRARHNVYHLECFACQQCSHRFCVGDRFYLCENKILCEYDYEERMVFANMAYNPPPISHLKRQTNIHPPPPPHMQGIGGPMSQPCSSDMGSPDRRGAASMQQVPQQQQQQQSQQAVNVAVSSSGSTGSNGFHDGLGLGQGLGQGMSQGLSQGMGQGLSQGLGVGPGLGSK